jgi:hypothetical protein
VFPELPKQPGYFKRRRLADTLEWLMGMFAGHSPGFHDDPLLIDSTPLECARSRETAKRSAVGDAADYGSCPSHSRHSWGLRLHAILAPDGTPRAPALRSPNADERAIGLILPDRRQRHGGKVLLGDGGHASRGFAAPVTERDATGPRPCHKQERGTRPASGSNRSSGPTKTSAPSNATAPAPTPASKTASPHASAASPPRSPQPPTRTQELVNYSA